MFTADPRSLAVMQPYFSPYLGYFCLMASVETFVIFDSVQFTRRSWITRNRIRSENEPWQYFGIPTLHAPQRALINQIQLVRDLDWAGKMQKKLKNLYGHEPHFSKAMESIEPVWKNDQTNLAEALEMQLKTSANFLGLSTNFKRSSDLDAGTSLKGEERILALCKLLGATSYYNLPGGRALYSEATFNAARVNLRFIPPLAETAIREVFPRYSSLSFFDLMCRCGSSEIHNMISWIFENRVRLESSVQP